MRDSLVVEGTLVEAGGDDPDLARDFDDFAEQLRGEASSGGSIAVFEVPTDPSGQPRPNTYRKTKLFTMPVGSATLDDVCDRVVQEFLAPGQTMMIQVLGRRDGDRGFKFNKMFPLRRANGPGAGSQGAGSELAQVIKLLSEQRRADMQEIRELVTQSRAPQGDPLKEGLAIAERITGMMTAALAGRVPGAAPATDPMNALAVMMMTKMMERSFDQMTNPPAPRESGGDDGTLKAIADMAKPLLMAHVEAQKRLTVQMQQRAALPQPGAPATPPAQESNNVEAAPSQAAPAPKTPEEKEMKMMAVLSEFLPMLISNFVEKDAKPADTAKLALDSFDGEDQELNAGLYQLVQSEPKVFLAKLTAIDKRAADHAEWFEQFRAELAAGFEPDKPA